MTRASECDVLVVGLGAAGCLASTRLATAGAAVIAVGRGSSATSLSTGRVDLSGVEGEASLGPVLRALGEARGLLQSPIGPRRAVTNMGTVGAQTLTSDHDWVLGDAEPVAVVGLRGNQDLDPAPLCAALAVRARGLRCRPHYAEASLPCSVPAGADIGDEARSAVEALAEIVGELGEGTVVLPPVFAGPGHAGALAALERSAGRRVREAATPLSNPGLRLQACLEDGARRAGATLWKGREVCSIEVERCEAVEVAVRSGLREVRVRPRAVLLATGNLISGGLSPQGSGVVDPLGAFATARAEGPRVRSTALTDALSTGIMCRGGRAVLAGGAVASNVFVAGSVVPGLSYPLGRGLGAAMADAWARAETVREAL